MKVELSRPVEHGGTTYTEIDIDEPTVGAMEAYDIAKQKGLSDVTAMLSMYTFDTKIPMDVFRKMRATDMKRIRDVLAPFVKELSEDSGDTGEPSPPTSPPSSTLQ